jgi:hypothetical protein
MSPNVNAPFLLLVSAAEDGPHVCSMISEGCRGRDWWPTGRMDGSRAQEIGQISPKGDTLICVPLRVNLAQKIDNLQSRSKEVKNGVSSAPCSHNHFRSRLRAHGGAD